MWSLSVPWWEIVLRSAIIYVGLMIAFRAMGKKQLGQMSPFDFILLLIISEGVSNGLTGQDPSLIGSLLSACTLIGLSYAADYISFKSRKIEKILEGEPHVIVFNGQVREQIRRKYKVTLDEIKESLREHEIEKIEDVHLAVLETNGRITAIKKNS